LKILTAAFIATIVAGTALALARGGAPTEATSPAAKEASTYDACYMSQRFVTARLKAPASADFPSCREALITPQANGAPGQRYTVSSYVDSQNSFGAKLRNNYVAVVQYDGVNQATQNYDWSLVSLNIDGQFFKNPAEPSASDAAAKAADNCVIRTTDRMLASTDPAQRVAAMVLAACRAELDQWRLAILRLHGEKLADAAIVGLRKDQTAFVIRKITEARSGK
jgi:hypothetical protein